MEIEQRIASLARAANEQKDKYARIEMRRIMNTFITSTGQLRSVKPPEELEQEARECKEILNETLFELDQAIGERDGLERCDGTC